MTLEKPSLAALLAIPPKERGIRWRDLVREAGGDLAKIETGKSNRGRPPVDPERQKEYDATLPQHVLAAGLPAAARRVLAVLRHECGSGHRCTVIRRDLARRADIAQRTVKKAVRRLEATGFITVERTKITADFNAPNLFTLTEKAFRLARTGAAPVRFANAGQKIFSRRSGTKNSPSEGDLAKAKSYSGEEVSGRAAVAARPAEVVRDALSRVTDAFEGRKGHLLP